MVGLGFWVNSSFFDQNDSIIRAVVESFCFLFLKMTQRSESSLGHFEKNPELWLNPSESGSD
jgi:hypothetical protein